MQPRILASTDERLVSPELVARVGDACASCGGAVVLVPSLPEALEVQRALADKHLSLGVSVSTPALWAAERWEVWGDGRRVVGDVARNLLARRVLERACERPGCPLADTPGTAALLADLSRTGQPWLAAVGAAEDDEVPGATEVERALVALVPALGAELRAAGLVEGCEVMAALTGLLKERSVTVPPLTCVGFPQLSQMSRAERALLEGLAEQGDVAVIERDGALCSVPRAAELSALIGSLFKPVAAPLAATGAVRLALPAGSSAEPELACRAVAELAAEGCTDIVVAAPDAAGAWRELSGRLAARGIASSARLSLPVAELEPGRAFLEFARSVAHLAELARTWPAAVPVAGAPRAGTVRVELWDMSWWPPRELSDFLCSEIAHMESACARRLDVTWRGNRLLTPPAVLEQLTSTRAVSQEVASATRELLRGRLGAAASKLLAPYEQGAAAALPGASEARAALGTVLEVARTLGELGVSADPERPDAVSLEELVSLAEDALARTRVSLRPERAVEGSRAAVRILDASSASRLAPGSADALVVLGQTSEEAAVSEHDDERTFILRAWGIDDPPSAMEHERERFRSLVRVPGRALILERTLFGARGAQSYPSVMLSEVLSCYGLGAEAGPRELAHVLGPACVSTRSEVAISENVVPAGGPASPAGSEIPSAAGHIDEGRRALVSPPPEGPAGAQALPVFSASQIESYLECPYKWFSLRRLRLRDADAGFSGAEMGTFAHRVLEVSRRELVARAREDYEGGRTLKDLCAAHPDAMQREDYRDEVEALLARAQAEPTVRLASSTVSAGANTAGAELARAVLDEEFDAHLAHQYQLIGGRKPLPQALVPHLAREHGQLEGLRRDLASLLDFERGALCGFEPRFFEWGFGRRSEPPISYAGVLLTGTVDRIDVDAHGQVAVIDYKHKAPAGFTGEYDALGGKREPGSFSLPRRVQALIYAQVVRRAFPDLTVRAALYLGTKGGHALAGAVDENLVDVVFGAHMTSKRAETVAVPRDDAFGLEGPSGMEALLDATEQAIAAKMERLLSGDIEAAPLDKEACRFCPVLNCERRIPS